MFKLNAKFGVGSLLYLLSHFKCECHTEHSTCAHSVASTTPTDSYSEVVIVHTCTFQSTLLGCQVTLMPHNRSHINNSGTFSGQTSCTQVGASHWSQALLADGQLWEPEPRTLRPRTLPARLPPSWGCRLEGELRLDLAGRAPVGGGV